MKVIVYNDLEQAPVCSKSIVEQLKEVERLLPEGYSLGSKPRKFVVFKSEEGDYVVVIGPDRYCYHKEIRKAAEVSSLVPGYQIAGGGDIEFKKFLTGTAAGHKWRAEISGRSSDFGLWDPAIVGHEIGAALGISSISFLWSDC